MLECLWSKRYDLKRVNVVHIESYFVQYLDIMNIRLVSQYYQWPTLDVMFILQKQLTSNLSFSLQILPQMSVRPNHPHKHTISLWSPDMWCQSVSVCILHIFHHLPQTPWCDGPDCTALSGPTLTWTRLSQTPEPFIHLCKLVLTHKSGFHINLNTGKEGIFPNQLFTKTSYGNKIMHFCSMSWTLSCKSTLILMVA